MAVRRALEWIECSKTQLFFHTCFPSLIAGAHDFAFTLPCAPAGNICSDLAHSVVVAGKMKFSAWHGRKVVESH